MMPSCWNAGPEPDVRWSYPSGVYIRARLERLKPRMDIHHAQQRLFTLALLSQGPEASGSFCRRRRDKCIGVPSSILMLPTDGTGSQPAVSVSRRAYVLIVLGPSDM